MTSIGQACTGSCADPSIAGVKSLGLKASTCPIEVHDIGLEEVRASFGVGRVVAVADAANHRRGTHRSGRAVHRKGQILGLVLATVPYTGNARMSACVLGLRELNTIVQKTAVSCGVKVVANPPEFGDGLRHTQDGSRISRSRTQTTITLRPSVRRSSKFVIKMVTGSVPVNTRQCVSRAVPYCAKRFRVHRGGEETTTAQIPPFGPA
jgi:hypothetical protein